MRTLRTLKNIINGRVDGILVKMDLFDVGRCSACVEVAARRPILLIMLIPSTNQLVIARQLEHVKVDFLVDYPLGLHDQLH